MQKPIQMHESNYKKGELIATRKAYGQSLTQLGAACKDVVSLDAEVKNSTFAQLFEDKYPKRFFQCFIAEQNMVGMAIGFARRNKMPFVSTFACFFSRAYDQIRMAAIGTSPLRLIGSHAGVSIGQDGPSQMGLEDIAIMRALPESIVLYPCDAPSTHALLSRWQIMILVFLICALPAAIRRLFMTMMSNFLSADVSYSNQMMVILRLLLLRVLRSMKH